MRLVYLLAGITGLLLAVAILVHPLVFPEAYQTPEVLAEDWGWDYRLKVAGVFAFLGLVLAVPSRKASA